MKLWKKRGAKQRPPTKNSTVKDRDSRIPINSVTRILFRRSSSYPIEYALMLQIKTSTGWKTQIVADNAHEREDVDEHHFHRYIADQKRDPESLPFAVNGTNEAMAKIVQWFKDDWKELIK